MGNGGNPNNPTSSPALPLSNSEILERITDASKNARKLYHLFLFFLIYFALTAASTSDKQLVLNQPAHLPILELDISLKWFFIVGPFILVILFLSLQFYMYKLKRLRDSLGENVLALNLLRQKLYPWKFNFILEDSGSGIINTLQLLIADFILWVALPIVLVLFALVYLKKHDFCGSYFIGCFWPLMGSALALFFWYSYKKEQKKHYRRHWLRYLFIFLVIAFEVSYVFYMIPAAKRGSTCWRILESVLFVDLNSEILVCEPTIKDSPTPWLRLPKINLSGADLSGAILTRAQLQKAILDHATLQRTNLEYADLSGAHLTDSRFNNASLNCTNLSNVTADSAYFAEAQLDDVKFIGASLMYANFSWAHLNGHAQLIGANLHGVNLANAQLHNACLAGAHLDNANLIKADLAFAYLDSTDFCGAVLINAILNNADLRAAKFQGARLDNADLRFAKLQGAVFGKEAILTSAILDGADLCDVDLRGNLSVTAEQLSKVSYLYNAQLESTIRDKIEARWPHLLKTKPPDYQDQER